MRMTTFLAATLLAASPTLAQGLPEDPSEPQTEGAGAPDPLRYGDDQRFVSVEPFLQVDGGYADSRPRSVLGDEDEREWSGVVRRARIYTDFGYDDVGGRVTIDFANLASEAITYAYLNYAVSDRLTIQGGQQTLLFSLEDLIGSRGSVFAEDGLNSALVPTKSVGLAALYGTDRLSLSGGVFGGSLNERAFDDGSTLTARGTFAPYHKDGDALHLGLGLLQRRDPRLPLSFSGDAGLSLADVSLVSTGDYEDVSRYRATNLEVGGTFGRFFFQGELTLAEVRDRDRGSANLQGGYLYAGLFLTDDHRGYEAETGLFEQIKPARGLDEGGPGAVQIGARLGFLDLDDALLEDEEAGSQVQATAVANWFLTERFRVSADYTYTHVRSGELAGADTHAGLARFWFIY